MSFQTSTSISLPLSAANGGTGSTTGTPATEIGSIKMFSHVTVPSGWLTSYGQAVSRTTYALLYAVIGTVWGVGDGSTTFNLPDLRGRGIHVSDTNGGAAANRLNALSSGGVNGTLGSVGGEQSHTLSNPDEIATPVGVTSGVTDNCYNSDTSAQPHNNMPPTVVMIGAIYTGVA